MAAHFRTKGPSCPCTVTSSSGGLDLACCCFHNIPGDDARWGSLFFSWTPGGRAAGCLGFSDKRLGDGLGGTIVIQRCDRGLNLGILFLGEGFLAGVAMRCGIDGDTTRLSVTIGTNCLFPGDGDETGEASILSCNPFHAVFESDLGMVEITE